MRNMKSSNDPAGPRGTGAGRSASGSPSSGRTAGGLGLTTGSTIYGNTAFGPAGGRATGYATKNKDGSFSNFRATDGTRMFSGNDRVFSGNNAGAGLGALMVRQAAAPVPASASVAQPYVDPYVPPAEVPSFIGDAFWPGQNTRPPAARTRGLTAQPGLGFRYNIKLPTGQSPGSYWENPTQLPYNYNRRPNALDAAVAPRTTNRTISQFAGSRDIIGRSKATGPLGAGWQDRVPGSNK